MTDQTDTNLDPAQVTRRRALGMLAGAAGATAVVAGAANSANSSEGGERAAKPRMPTVFLPHGGGPWPWMDMRPITTAEETRKLADYLESLTESLPRRPRAMVVVSAHWEAKVPTVQSSPRPPMYYDYGGFPPEMYEIQWPAPGDPGLAARVRGLLEGAGFETADDPRRGFDHGTFVPLKLAFPEADVPAVQLSLDEGLDPQRHLELGRALAPLRDDDVLLVGSGMSFHNMRPLRTPAELPEGLAKARAFDTWLRETVVAEPGQRDAQLVAWSEAPMARYAHPREEHLLPLMVMAGAAGQDRASAVFEHTFAGFPVSSVHFGASHRERDPGERR
ncbi:MAG: class III extradiol ring-cleavage dioxygenase [Myxococcota bacterium]